MCSRADLQGTYRVWGAGTSLASDLITAVGYRILDGQGHLTSAEDTRSVAGQISHRIGRTADYTVDSSCAVTEVFADRLILRWGSRCRRSRSVFYPHQPGHNNRSAL